jgi:hypothetical protein
MISAQASLDVVDVSVDKGREQLGCSHRIFDHCRIAKEALNLNRNRKGATQAVDDAAALRRNLNHRLVLAGEQSVKAKVWSHHQPTGAAQNQ